jgi:hypothetical protein
MQRRSFPKNYSTYSSHPIPTITTFHVSRIRPTLKTSLYVGRLVLGGDVLERNLNVLLGQVHLSGKGRVGLPLARGAGCGLLHHLVDLLEGEALGLRDEEVGEEDYLRMSDVFQVLKRVTGNLQETQQSPPHMKKMFEPSLAESSRSATRYGVMTEMMQFQNQLEAFFHR